MSPRAPILRWLQVSRTFQARSVRELSAAPPPAGETSTPSPLSGIRVLDLTRVLAGPYCTMILGDLGAEIIKIEHPDGDETRHWGPPFLENGQNRESCYFLCANRNKKSVCVDFKHKSGVDLLRSLSTKCDVVVENFLPGKLDALGLGFSALQSLRAPDSPGLVFCSVSGLGPDGPYAQRPGYDVIAASLGGLMHITGPRDGAPCKVGVALTDVCTGLYAHGAIMAALWQRQKDAKPQKIDCNLLSTQVATLVNLGSNYLNSGQEAQRMGTEHASIVPYQTFRVKDGWMTIGCGNDRLFRELCERIGRADLADHPDFASNELRVRHRATLIPELESELSRRSLSEWEASFAGAAFPHGAVNSLERVFADEHVRHVGLVRDVAHPALGRDVKVVGPPVAFSGIRNEVRSAPPSLGQHTDQVLGELVGLDDHEIAALREQGVIA